MKHDSDCKNPVWFSHAQTYFMDRIRQRIEASPPLVMTMREPMAVARSWYRRGKAMDDFFRSIWLNLFTLSDEYEHFWLPVDTDDRDQRIQALSDYLGVGFVVNWTPKNSYTHEPATYRGEMSLDDCRDFYRKHWHRFEPFYGPYN